MEDKKLGDFFGYPLEIGDKVIMASNAKGNDSIYSGKITEINIKNNFIKIKKDGGSSNKRNPNQVFSLKPSEEFMPELFL